MGKDKAAKAEATPPDPSRERSPQREALAAAIAIRDEADPDDKLVSQARERARDDLFKANRAVEAAERALASARETARLSLVGAYVDGDDGAAAPATIDDAEAALAKARTRQAEMKMIADELAAHQRAPGWSIPNRAVEDAMRAIVKNHLAVRRLCEDFDTARRVFQQHEATLIFLAGQHCIPSDLIDVAPKAHATRFADADPQWVQALEALKQDADFQLPNWGDENVNPYPKAPSS